ncbi:sugar dehydrogenase complex small subunit [Polyangium sp. 15x6]|uniref:sugar dehydrogenase complex small subunit n=1 Tax=Polyangium sp. 15x6 TaxID=3042687 RepID=UPI00249C1DB2|nr:sugar dehydrogenase complex small subunit [Polyangium sp. 15x6]MDI3290931.1 sugar dehydrogenase complex small subunit [Polyangium sp. 15x6]
MDRRGFLGGVSALFAASLVPACSDDPVVDGPLARFLSLSALLTGFENLPRAHGQIYLDALRASAEQSLALDELYAEAGYGRETSPGSLADLEAKGTFDDARLRAVADAIILNWYTGVYEGASGPEVATYTEALTWRALDYTNPPSECGGLTGFWAESPEG